MSLVSDFPTIPDAWYLTGATASGKSDVSIALARRLDAEIISLDSMAVYRGMDVGTAKPAPDDRGGITHHLIDVVDPTEDYSVTEYLTAAHRCVADIRSRGHEVLFVGGTPLYLKALLRGMASGPEANWPLRDRLADEAREQGPEVLHRRLAEVDPVSASKLHPNDVRRTIRALEVFETTGQPLSQSQDHFSQPSDAKRVIVLDWPRDVLHSRINTRVERMFDGGLIDEVQGLLARYGALGPTARQAVGYREVLAYLADGAGWTGAVDRTKARTRQLARRQLVSYRGLAECRWWALVDPVDAEQIAEQIAMVSLYDGFA